MTVLYGEVLTIAICTQYYELRGLFNGDTERVKLTDMFTIDDSG
jgi:hypothetical protein